jgi:hypothetical protein
MRKHGSALLVAAVAAAVVAVVLTAFAPPAFAGHRSFHGRISYRDGSLCRKCRVSGVAAGMVGPVYTDSHGEYQLSYSGGPLRKLFVNGDTVWEGEKGGGRLDATVR